MRSKEKIEDSRKFAPEARALIWDFLKKYWKPFGYGIASLAIVDAMDVLPPLIIMGAIDGLKAGGGMTILAEMAGLFLAAGIIQAVFRYFWRKYFLGTSHIAAYDLRRRMFEHLQTLSFGFFNRTKTGELMSRLTNDIDEIRQMFGLGMLLFMDSLFYFCSVPFIMIWLSPKLALYILVPLPIIPFFVVKIGTMIHEKSTVVQELLATLSAKAQENISGIRVVKSFTKEDEEIASFKKVSGDLVDGTLTLAKIEAGFHPALEFAMGIGIFLLIFIGSGRVVSGEISLGAFVAFQAYLLKMVWPMTAVGLTINLYQRGLASMCRCAEILTAKPEVVDLESSQEPTASLKGEIEVRNLTFTYPEASAPALSNVSFKIEAGKTLGLVGPVGSGKTTLLHLLLRLYNAPSGSIFLDGIELEKYPLKTLREAFGYVPQDTFLFSESILENIVFGIKDKNDYQRAKSCAVVAHLLDEINSLPNQMDTLLGERGVNLSGGQKQRLSLARALALDPKILILDDATSAVDTDTEEKIIKELRMVLRNRTAIIVSHRLASVQGADRIIYLENGEAVEHGTHDELLRSGGRYARTWEKQRLKSELEKDGNNHKTP